MNPQQLGRRSHVHRYNPVLAPVPGTQSNNAQIVYRCTVALPDGTRCNRVRDEARVAMGRNNKKRGHAIQRKAIRGLGGTNLPGNIENLDGLGTLMRYESKSTKRFPNTYWRWLQQIPAHATQSKVLIVTEAGGKPGQKARSIVIVDYETWRELHGE